MNLDYQISKGVWRPIGKQPKSTHDAVTEKEINAMSQAKKEKNAAKKSIKSVNERCQYKMCQYVMCQRSF